MIQSILHTWTRKRLILRAFKKGDAGASNAPAHLKNGNKFEEDTTTKREKTLHNR